AWRRAHHRLRIWAAHSGRSGRRVMQAAHSGQSRRRVIRARWLATVVGALGLGAIALFFVPPPTSPPRVGPARPPPLVATPGVPVPPPNIGPVIERPPPRATPRQLESMGAGPVQQPSVQGVRRGGTVSRITSEAPPSQPAGRGVSATMALLQSAEAGNLTEVGDIIDAGVSPNVQDSAGMTPLMMAVTHDHRPVV